MKNIKLFLFSLCIGIIFSFANIKSYAQNSHCDPQIMDLLETRAWLTAQREIVSNQNLIYKPDSTLEYSCFDWLADMTGFNFSNSGRDYPMSEARFS